MDDIIAIFSGYIEQYGSIDIAENEFKRSIHEDPELRKLYVDWCNDVGSTEKNGFLDFCDEYMESQNDVWDSLNDYDNDE